MLLSLKPVNFMYISKKTLIIFLCVLLIFMSVIGNYQQVKASVGALGIALSLLEQKIGSALLIKAGLYVSGAGATIMLAVLVWQFYQSLPESSKQAFRDACASAVNGVANFTSDIWDRAVSWVNSNFNVGSQTYSGSYPTAEISLLPSETIAISAGLAGEVTATGALRHFCVTFMGTKIWETGAFFGTGKVINDYFTLDLYDERVYVNFLDPINQVLQTVDLTSKFTSEQLALFWNEVAALNYQSGTMNPITKNRSVTTELTGLTWTWENVSNGKGTLYYTYGDGIKRLIGTNVKAESECVVITKDSSGKLWHSIMYRTVNAGYDILNSVSIQSLVDTYPATYEVTHTGTVVGQETIVDNPDYDPTDAMGNVTVGVPETIETLIGATAETVSQPYAGENPIETTTWWQNALDGVSSVFSSAISGVQSIGQSIWDIATNIWEWLQEFWESLAEALSTALAGVITWLSGIYDQCIAMVQAIAGINTAVAEADLTAKVTQYKIPDLFILVLKVILACIRLILRALIYLATIVSIQADSSLINGYTVQGIQFFKNQQVPNLNISVWNMASAMLTLLFSLSVVRRIRRM